MSETLLVIAVGSVATAAQTDNSSMTAAAGAEARVLVIGCEDEVTARAGESRRIARASTAVSGYGRGISGATSNIAEANAGDAMADVPSRGKAGISAKARESRVASGRIDGATAAKTRVPR